MIDKEELIAHLDVLMSADKEAPDENEDFATWWLSLKDEERSAISAALLAFNQVPNGDPMAAGAKLAANILSTKIESVS
jgi:hypothetical protein